MEFNSKQWKYLAFNHTNIIVIYAKRIRIYNTIIHTKRAMMGRWTVGSADFQRVRWKLLAFHRPKKTRPLKNHPTCSSCSTTICYRNSGQQHLTTLLPFRFDIKDSGHHYSPTISWCLQPRHFPHFVSSHRCGSPPAYYEELGIFQALRRGQPLSVSSWRVS